MPRNDEVYIPIAKDQELRCPTCNKLLAKGTLGKQGKLEILCPRWKTHSGDHQECEATKLCRFAVLN